MSLMHEVLYVFTHLKRAKPELKFVLVSEFEQLPPVNDRLENPNDENTRALYERCDGNKLTLTTCRRADDKLFNMLALGNISKIQKLRLDINLKVDIHPTPMQK